MLTKRTHIMLDETTFQVLATLAHTKNASIGHLVRTAVEKAYLSPSLTKTAKAQKSYHGLLTWQNQIGITKHIDYRELIEHGRSR